jgi:hypothetical protein
MPTTTHKIEPTHTGVPVDQLDRNHPHFPADLEDQLPPRPYYKRVNKIGMLVFGAVVLLVVAAVLGANVGTDCVEHDDSV